MKTLRLHISFDPKAGNPTPVRLELDFDQILSRPDALVDPHTFMIVRELSGRTCRYPVQFDERFYVENRGWIGFLADDPKSGGDWRLEYELRGADAKMAPTPYLPMVGLGDEIAANGAGLNPIGVPGMHQDPIPVDWDGDGLIDIISSSHYGNRHLMPWSGIFFWKNLGTNEKPRYAPPVRMYADGVSDVDSSQRTMCTYYPDYTDAPGFGPISEYYIRADVFDWFGTGRQDLVTCSRKAGIKVYRNTGRCDRAGMPRLELAIRIDLPKCLAPAAYMGFRCVGWDGSGRGSFVIGISFATVDTTYDQLLLMRQTGDDPEKPEFELMPFGSSNFWKPDTSRDPVSMDEEDIGRISNPSFRGFRCFKFDVFDIDGDGKHEIILLHGKARKGPVMEVWRNVGSNEVPVLCNEGSMQWSRRSHYYGFRFCRNEAFDGCLLGENNSGDGIHFYKRDYAQEPICESGYRDQGRLEGEGVSLNPEGYTRPVLIPDADTGFAAGTETGADGRLQDLFMGDEAGFLTLSRNCGTRDRPAYSWPEKVTDAAGRILHLNRETLIEDNDGEFCCGQLKPFVCDWDGDGQLDIILGNNTNHIYWLKGYDLETNRIAEMVMIRVEGDHNPFGWRKGPAVFDIDGDGTLELIAISSNEEFTVYRQSESNPAILHKVRTLCYEDGTPIVTTDMPPQKYKYGIVCIHAADWTGNGVFDLIVGTNSFPSLLENVESNAEPVFKRAVPFTTPLGPIDLGLHEEQATAWDWDGDGRLDLVVGGESGKLYLFHRDWLDGIVNECIVADEES